jgi:hypothetical protein
LVILHELSYCCLYRVCLFWLFCTSCLIVVYIVYVCFGYFAQVVLLLFTSCMFVLIILHKLSYCCLHRACLFWLFCTSCLIVVYIAHVCFDYFAQVPLSLAKFSFCTSSVIVHSYYFVSIIPYVAQIMDCYEQASPELLIVVYCQVSSISAIFIARTCLLIIT